VARFPTIVESEVPFLTTEQMVEVDRAMAEDFGITLAQMMENAGRALATLARERFLEGDPRGKAVTVLVGTGGNGGGAMVCARRLAGWGASVQVVTSRVQEAFKGVPAQQLGTLRRMGVPVAAQPEAAKSLHLVVDGLIGYGLEGAPRGGAAELIDWANEQKAPTLSLDTPSGLDTTSGMAFAPCITAAAALTLALPKEGLRFPAARARIGELYVADIGVPPSLYTAPPLEIAVPLIFARGDIVRLVGA